MANVMTAWSAIDWDKLGAQAITEAQQRFFGYSYDGYAHSWNYPTDMVEYCRSLIRQIQAALNYFKLKSGYTPFLTLTEDGLYGANTMTAVQIFQGAKGLSVDGLVGQKTWSALAAQYIY
ncbi:MAG: peptidoglycan-binding protein [Propionibacteriaceae bacterium]|jgi:peptidoglycan hydrolase-like protein with peptidoglycan-binding domain|nr:peptidoglycan-binding protein [Propionibacteriaceae bacterium]